MGAGGVIVPPESYFAKIQPVLKKYDVLMVADEVICGFGRTGNMWGSDTYGIAPDLITCAKQLSSAYLPIAGVLMSDRFYGVLADAADRLGTLGMGYTYGGHPVRGRGRGRDAQDLRGRRHPRPRPRGRCRASSSA